MIIFFILYSLIIITVYSKTNPGLPGAFFTYSYLSLYSAGSITPCKGFNLVNSNQVKIVLDRMF